MMQVTRSITIAGPIDGVFAFVADLERLPVWQPEVVEVRCDGPLAVGSRYTEVRVFLGKRFESTLEVTALEPPTLLSLRVVKGPVPISVRHTFTTEDESTLVRIDGEGDEKRLRGLTGALVGRQAARRLEGDLARLKAALEGGGDAGR